MEDKTGVKKLAGWDTLAKKSQSGSLNMQTSTQFELFRKHAREKEEKVLIVLTINERISRCWMLRRF